jgi:hypothetical protein
MSRPDKIPLNTTFDIVTLAALAFLASREDPGRGAANVPIRRLVREELDRLAPGAWDELVAAAAELPEGLTPREGAAQLSAILRGRVAQ